MLALLLALVATGLSLIAMSRAGDAKRLAAAPGRPGSGTLVPLATTAAPTDSPAPPVDSTPSDGTSPSDLPTGTETGPPPTVPTGTVQPTGTYKLFYQRKPLRIPVGDAVDLDQPRVFSSGSGADLQYGGYGLSSSLARAQIANADASPADCQNAIDTAPLNRNVTPSVGLTLCIVNDPAVASQEGISQKLFLVTVTSIAKDDTINVIASAWETPH
jgi:hypothetical protein